MYKRQVLYDIDREKLEIIAKLCNHVVAREGGDLTVRAVNDPVEAIRGMDYIVTTPVSYTHLDVYKRQVVACTGFE